ncbi:MAG: response regulator, partial [Candidatus Eisenbacteria bacterium]|nr:response regulator [Candidatus Eisenbacteria bacterium]
MDTAKKILVVDDDIDILEQVAMMMQAEGYAVVQAQGHEEAEEALLTTIPDLAVIDLMMENRDSGFVL